MAEVRGVLAPRFTLPYRRDLWVASAFVCMTHLFRIFDALPILRVAGGKGSGKSELASTIAGVAYAGCVMGQGSAAALVRLAAGSGGLVVLDDAENLATDGGGFGELAQCLKVSYRRSTAMKPVVIGGRCQTMDFFGPRLITATRDVDPILGSRCVTITTRAEHRLALPSGDFDPGALRDELRTLAMARVGDVERGYRELIARRGGRADEIRAPLLAIAETLGGPDMRTALRERLADGVATSLAA